MIGQRVIYPTYGTANMEALFAVCVVAADVMLLVRLLVFRGRLQLRACCLAALTIEVTTAAQEKSLETHVSRVNCGSSVCVGCVSCTCVDAECTCACLCQLIIIQKLVRAVAIAPASLSLCIDGPDSISQQEVAYLVCMPHACAFAVCCYALCLPACNMVFRMCWQLRAALQQQLLLAAFFHRLYLGGVDMVSMTLCAKTVRCVAGCL
jgi:hypothetical protein